MASANNNSSETSDCSAQIEGNSNLVTAGSNRGIRYKSMASSSQQFSTGVNFPSAEDDEIEGAAGHSSQDVFGEEENSAGHGKETDVFEALMQQRIAELEAEVEEQAAVIDEQAAVIDEQAATIKAANKKVVTDFTDFMGKKEKEMENLRYGLPRPLSPEEIQRAIDASPEVAVIKHQIKVLEREKRQLRSDKSTHDDMAKRCTDLEAQRDLAIDGLTELIDKILSVEEKLKKDKILTATEKGRLLSNAIRDMTAKGKQDVDNAKSGIRSGPEEPKSYAELLSTGAASSSATSADKATIPPKQAAESGKKLTFRIKAKHDPKPPTQPSQLTSQLGKPPPLAPDVRARAMKAVYQPSPSSSSNIGQPVDDLVTPKMLQPQGFGFGSYSPELNMGPPSPTSTRADDFPELPRKDKHKVDANGTTDRAESNASSTNTKGHYWPRQTL